MLDGESFENRVHCYDYGNSVIHRNEVLLENECVTFLTQHQNIKRMLRCAYDITAVLHTTPLRLS